MALCRSGLGSISTNVRKCVPNLPMLLARTSVLFRRGWEVTGNFPRSGQYNASFLAADVRTDESKIDEFVLMHLQDVVRE